MMSASPPATAGLLLWLDSANSASVTTDGGGHVTSWQNLAPGATNAVSYSGANDNSTSASYNSAPPTYVTGPDNVQVVSFNGNGYLDNLNFSTATPTSLTVFVLASAASNPGGFSAFMATSASQSANDYQTGINIDQGEDSSTSFNRLNVEGAEEGGNGGPQLLSSPIAFNTFHTFQVNEGTTVSDSVDGVVEGSVAGGTNPISLNNLFIGTRSYTSGFVPTSNHDLQGEIATVLVYSGTLSGSALAQTENYLTNFFTPAVTDTSPISTTITKSTLPTKAVGGISFSGSVSVKLDNTDAALEKGTVTEGIYASTDGYIDSTSVLLATVSKHASLKSGKTASFAVAVKNKTLPAGSYTVIAETTDSNELVSLAPTTPSLVVATPVVSLTAVSNTIRPSVFSNRPVSFSSTITVTNTGNIPAAGQIVFTAEPYNTANPQGTLSGSQTTFSANLKPGKSRKFTLLEKYAKGLLTAGIYNEAFSITLDGSTASATSPLFTVG
jgi:hypothetical protein